MSADLHKLASALNDRQRRFAEELVKGRNQTEAYRLAGYESTRPEVEASKLVRNTKVSEYIDALRAQAADETVLTIAEKRIKLASIVRELPEGGLLRDQLAAIKIDNEMAGHNKPTEVNLGGSFIDAIRQIAAKRK